MLRILVVALLAANILLVILELLQPPTEPEPAYRTPPAVTGLPRLALLSEHADGRSELERCFTLGPFRRGPVFDGLMARVGQGSGWTRVRTTSAVVERGYWVHLPSFGNEDEADAAAAALRAEGISDVAVLQAGEYPNTVSLGLYDEREDADRRRTEIAALGYAPRVLVRRDTENRYWLDYAPGSIPANAPALADAPGIVNRPLPCPPLAPVEDEPAVEDTGVESAAEPETPAPGSGQSDS